jgi:hypothetical protein
MNRSMCRRFRSLVVLASWCVLAPLWLASCVSDSGPTPPVFGSIAIITLTSGSEPDPDGYTVSVEEVETFPIGTNATLMLANFTPQTYSVELDGIAENCVALNGTTQAVQVEPEAIAEVTFELNCGDEPIGDPPTALFTIANGSESVTEGGVLEVTVPAGTSTTFAFDASRSEPGEGSTITGYEWQSNGVTIGTTPTFEHDLDEGEWVITLTVTNSAGLSQTASATIVVAE